MAAAYARDSGARLNHWSFYQPIQDDELFSYGSCVMPLPTVVRRWCFVGRFGLEFVCGRWKCHAPVQPQRLVPLMTDCSTCHACGAPLGSNSHVSICPLDAIRVQSVADDTLRGAGVSKQASEWFEYTCLLVSLVRYAMRS